MDRPHWPQEIVVKPMGEIVQNPTNSTNINNNNNNLSNKPSSSSSSSFERRVVKPQAVNCPRCDSTNTKFCYYNNYSLSQPRYFCKTCRRYWTEGGTLRNIPVGGGSRKNKRSSSISSVSKKLPDLVIPSVSTSSVLTHIHHDHYGQDLNLGFPSTTQNFKNFSEYFQASNTSATISTTSSVHQISALELLTGITARGGGGGGTMNNGYMTTPIIDQDPNSVSMIPMMPEFKIPSSSLGFSLNGMENGGGNIYGNNTRNSLVESSTRSGRILFPFEELKSNTSTTDNHDDDQQNRDDDDQNGDSNGFWNGMMGGGGSW